MTYRRKLIEVSLPLEAINKESTREKSIRHGHPSTLHLWWARRPLASCRAVLFAQLVDDPSAWPDLFPTPEAQEAERERLFAIIRELVKWENSSKDSVLLKAQTEIARSIARSSGDRPPEGSKAVRRYLAVNAPPVLDPFCGGGSIPLEAQRLGLRAYGSDLNPVAVLITKALIEIPPKFSGVPPVNPQAGKEPSLLDKSWHGAHGLAEDVRHYGEWMRNEAEKRIGKYYPKVRITVEMTQDRPDLKPYLEQELTVIAWLWARTVASPNPACNGAHVPLVRSFWLSKKKGKEAWVEPIVDRDTNSYRFAVRVGKPPAGVDPGKGTVRRTGATCLLANAPIPFDHIRSEGRAGRMGARLMAIVCEGDRGRIYLSPDDEQEQKAHEVVVANYPETDMPNQALGFRVQLYGMDKHYKLFTPRQLLALTTFSDLVQEAREKVLADYLRANPSLGGRSSLGAQASSLHYEAKEQEQAGCLRSQVGNQEGSMRSQVGTVEPKWHSRGYLPHFEAGEISQSVTFRLADSIPQEMIQQWKSELSHLTASQADAERRKKIESYLDEGYGAAWLKHADVAGLVQEALLHFDGERYRLHEWVIMPNHVHVLFTPIGKWSISDILHAWKSYSANQANKMLHRSGKFWQEEYFDRAIRNEEHFLAASEYIRGNPVKAGLCESVEDWEFSSAGKSNCLQGAYSSMETPSSLGAQASSLHYEAKEQEQAGCLRSQGEGKHSSPQGQEQAGCLRSQGKAEDAIPLADGGTGATAYADAVATYLGMGVDKLADYNSVICSWTPDRDTIRNTFSRQAIPMIWDYTEGNPFSDSTGNWTASLEWISKTLLAVPATPPASCVMSDAAQDRVAANQLISFDPPYYDNIGYSDLSDFFYVWLRRSLGKVHPDLFGTLLTPKAQELIASPYRHNGSRDAAQNFFEQGLGTAFGRMREVQSPDFPLTVYYAFKQSEDEGDVDPGSAGFQPAEEENNSGPNGRVPRIASTGWETMLSGLVRAGFSVHGTWPMRTERVNRPVATGTNALASSIVLVCRPRPKDAPLTTRREFISALKRELPRAVSDLQHGNIAPVDLAQASIGPGMAVFTRYAKVMESDGSAMSVRTALSLINQTLDEFLSQQEGEFDADTRWALAWFEQFGMDEGPFGIAETLSKAKNTGMNGLVAAGIVSAQGGKVKLVGRNEMPDDWDPMAHKHLTVWEVTQQLIHALDRHGEQGAADLARRLGGMGDVARDLSYRLYSICERKKWAQEALAYNSLVIAWPEITKLAQASTTTRSPEQAGMFHR